MFEVESDGAGTVRLKGRLDAAAASACEEALKPITQSVTLECSGLEYISSAGLAVLLGLYKRLSDKGLALKMVALSARVRNVFTYAGLEKLFSIE